MSAVLPARAALLLLLARVTAVPLAHEVPCGRDDPKMCPFEEGVLNVHIVPHTHDDVGWLKTVDQYYYGSKSRIQLAGVQYILDSVVRELWEEPSRRFIYVETAFFWKWWSKQHDVIRHKVHQLVRQGRLEFIGGAWSMNDEADVHYQSTVDQFTWGLRKLNETFGECGRPLVGWQIDPFGHSREMASLLAGMGYEGLFHGRIDYQDKRQRIKDRSMEMLWRGNDDLGAASDLFTGVLYNTYSPPPGFCFDVLCSDEPIIDDVSSPDYNVDDRVDSFLSIVRNMSRAYRTDNVLVTMGEDFNYQDARMWFLNLDKLIVSQFLGYAQNQSAAFRTNNVVLTMGGDFTYMDASMWYKNLDQLIKHANLKAAKDKIKVKLFYSTPSCYLKAVHAAKPTLPTKQDDFFPYASDPHAYWTGYFTSRPTVKYFERQGNNYLQTAKQLQVLAHLEDHNRFILDELKSAMGVMQHHDALTGTEKQHVADDYARILDNAIEDSLFISREAFRKLGQGNESGGPELEYQRCQLNVSECAASETNAQFVVTLYNPLAWSVDAPVRVPVASRRYTVYDPEGDEVASQVAAIPTQVLAIPTRRSSATAELVFVARSLPALGYRDYYVLRHDARTKRGTHWDHKLAEPFPLDLPEEYLKPTLTWQELQEKRAIHEMLKYISRKNENDKKNHYEQETLDKAMPNVEFYPDPAYGSEQIGDDKPADSSEEEQPKIKENYEAILSENRKALDEFRATYMRESKGDREMSLEQRQRKDARSKDLPFKFVQMSSVNEERMLGDDPMLVTAYPDDDPHPDSVGNENMRLYFDKATGATNLIFADGANVTTPFEMLYYPGCLGDNKVAQNRASGAYIFRPNATNPTPFKINTVKTYKGPVVEEMHFVYTDYITVVVRTYKGATYFDFDWTVGPIPIADNVGKEIIIRYNFGLKNKGVFYTDSNGRQTLKRVLNKRPQWNVSLVEPIAGNYYPVTSKISIEDESARASILNDRAQGGSSLNEGQIELMVHRRLLNDDAFGVGEALNETASGYGLVARGTHYFVGGSTGTTKNFEKIKSLEVLLQPQVFVSNASNISYDSWRWLKNEWSGLKKKLPEGVHILTLEPWKWGTILLRLENIFEKADLKGEDGKLSVDLNEVFVTFKIVKLTETSLAANQWSADRKPLKWDTENEFARNFNEMYEGDRGDSPRADVTARDEIEGLVVDLAPMQIRTFVVEYEKL